jgi:hypothetical protein
LEFLSTDHLLAGKLLTALNGCYTCYTHSYTTSSRRKLLTCLTYTILVESNMLLRILNKYILVLIVNQRDHGTISWLWRCSWLGRCYFVIMKIDSSHSIKSTSTEGIAREQDYFYCCLSGYFMIFDSLSQMLHCIVWAKHTLLCKYPYHLASSLEVADKDS